jgi:hypothetical protein
MFFDLLRFPIRKEEITRRKSNGTAQQGIKDTFLYHGDKRNGEELKKYQI